MARGPIPDFPADRPTVPEVLPEARALVSGGRGLGGLHCFLADGNTGGGFAADAVCDPDPAVAALARKLVAMTPTQRRKVFELVRRAALR